jgi:hypothetical protein
MPCSPEPRGSVFAHLAHDLTHALQAEPEARRDHLVRRRRIVVEVVEDGARRGRTAREHAQRGLDVAAGDERALGVVAGRGDVFDEGSVPPALAQPVEREVARLLDGQPGELDLGEPAGAVARDEALPGLARHLVGLVEWDGERQQRGDDARVVGADGCVPVQQGRRCGLSDHPRPSAPEHFHAHTTRTIERREHIARSDAGNAAR